MVTIHELNLRSFILCFQRDGVWKNIIHVCLVLECFQYCLNLLKIENKRYIEFAVAYPSGIQAVIVPRMEEQKTKFLRAECLPGKEQKLKEELEGSYWKMSTANLIT